MTFKRSTLRYGETPEPVTAYQKAAQVWDERIGSARAQAHNWRLMALGSLVLSLLLAGLLLWVGRSASIVPYIVEVDPWNPASNGGGPNTHGMATEPRDARERGTGVLEMVSQLPARVIANVMHRGQPCC